MLILLAAALLLAPPAWAEPTLNERVAVWSAGNFRSPLHCEIDGQLIRGVRRVLIRARPVLGRDPQVELEFLDFKPGDATRCIDATGNSVPNVVGRLELRRERNRHPETAQRDFKRMLQKDKGFTYTVAEGSLSIQSVNTTPAPPRDVGFAGGKLKLSLIYPATDADRALLDFPSERKILLTLKSRDGTVIEMPLFDPTAVWKPPVR